MATRAIRDLKNALIKEYTVAAGGATTAGRYVKFAAVDQEVVTAGAADGATAFGIAIETKTAGQRVSVALRGTAIVDGLVGTGGATRGVMQKLVADGVSDTTAGTDVLVGRAIQSGVVGDTIGLLV